MLTSNLQNGYPLPEDKEIKLMTLLKEYGFSQIEIDMFRTRLQTKPNIDALDLLKDLSEI